MKSHYLFFPIYLLFFMLLAACNGESHLASAVEGCWEGPQVDLSATNHHRAALWVTRAGDLKCSPTLTFVKEPESNGGEFTIEADYLFHGRSLTAVASGTWVAEGNDNILININPRSVNILAPAQVANMPYSTDNLSAQGRPLTYQQAITTNILSIVKIYDVRISDNTMNCEINDTDLKLYRKLND